MNHLQWGLDVSKDRRHEGGNISQLPDSLPFMSWFVKLMLAQRHFFLKYEHSNQVSSISLCWFKWIVFFIPPKWDHQHWVNENCNCMRQKRSNEELGEGPILKLIFLQGVEGLEGGIAVLGVWAARRSRATEAEGTDLKLCCYLLWLTECMVTDIRGTYICILM